MSEIIEHKGIKKYFTKVFWLLFYSRIRNFQPPLNVISTFEISTDDDLVLKDAGRYRWLRDQHWSDGKLTVVANKEGLKINAFCPSGERLDKIIDEELENKN